MQQITLSRREVIKGLACGSILAVPASCVENSQLGRSQFLLASEGSVARLSAQAWNDLKRSETRVTTPSLLNPVRRVMNRIITATGSNPSIWEVELFKNKAVNAFAMAGNRSGFFTGLLDFIDSDDELAVVAGHEIAHVVFKHNVERYSQQQAKQIGLQIASVLLNKRADKKKILQVLGIGTELIAVLPFSRFHESEADKFGLRFMHKAGYNPRVAIKFWQKMERKNRSRPLEILSTHPSYATRVANLKKEIIRLERA